VSTREGEVRAASAPLALEKIADPKLCPPESAITHSELGTAAKSGTSIAIGKKLDAETKGVSAAAVISMILIRPKHRWLSRLSKSCYPKTQIPEIRLLQSQHSLTVGAQAEHVG
jgi:hypothetical protein